MNSKNICKILVLNFLIVLLFAYTVNAGKCSTCGMKESKCTCPTQGKLTRKILIWFI
jgi:DTW domain-containing protein YfiP